MAAGNRGDVNPNPKSTDNGRGGAGKSFLQDALMDNFSSPFLLHT